MDGGTQAVLWMKLCAGMLVELLGVVGAVVGLSPALLGATVLAWGSSVADLAANAAVARKNPKMVLPPTPMHVSARGEVALHTAAACPSERMAERVCRPPAHDEHWVKRPPICRAFMID